MKSSLEPEHKTELKKIVKSGMSPAIIVQRTKILLLKDDGKSGESIAGELGVNRHTVDLWVKKYRQRKPENSIMEILSVSRGRGAQRGNHRRGKSMAHGRGMPKTQRPWIRCRNMDHPRIDQACQATRRRGRAWEALHDLRKRRVWHFEQEQRQAFSYPLLL